MSLIENQEESLARPDLHEIQKPELLPKEANSQYIKRYQRFFRKCDRAMLKLFYDLSVMDDEMTLFSVPIIIGTMEKAVVAMIGNSSRKDDSAQFLRVRLPLMSLIPGEPVLDWARYTYHEAFAWDNYKSEKKPYDVVYGKTRGIPINRSYRLMVWTKYMEDMNQILEQIILKFSQTANLIIPGVFFDSLVFVESISTTWGDEVGSQDLMVLRADIDMALQTYLPQPIRRAKTIHEVKIEFGYGNPEKIDSYEKDSIVKNKVKEGKTPYDYGKTKGDVKR